MFIQMLEGLHEGEANVLDSWQKIRNLASVGRSLNSVLKQRFHLFSGEVVPDGKRL